MGLSKLISPAFISTVPVWGGAESNLLNLSHQFCSQGVLPALILFHHGGNLAERFRTATLPVAEFTLHRWEFRSPWRYIQTYVQIILPLVTSQATLLHINHEYAMKYSIRAAQMTRLPAVAHIRGVRIGGWSKEEVACLKRAKAIIAVSQAVKQSLVVSGLPDQKIDVIYDGVPQCLLNSSPDRRGIGMIRGELGITASSPLIGIVGRVVPLKGIETFIRAAALVLNEIPQSRFIIAGSGSEEYIYHMKNCCRQLGIENQVHFLGFFDDVFALLSELDVLVLATHDPERRVVEACPNIVLEAMALRIPVVASASGGTVELLAEGRGLFFEPGNVGDLAKVILQCLLIDAPQREEMVERAFKAIKNEYNIAEQAQRILKVYANIMDPTFRLPKV